MQSSEFVSLVRSLEATPGRARRAAPSGDSSGGRMLLIEDDDADAELVGVYLVRQLPEWTFDWVRSLDDALCALEKNRYDMVLADITLPDADGLDVVLRIQNAVDAPPMIVLTGHADERLALETVRAGAQDFITKSQLDDRILKRTIRHAQERQRAEQDLRRLANFDSLTQLANRSSFEERVAQTVARSRRSEQRFALLYVDLDGFKAVNDTLGHEKGDALLVEVASRLRQTLRDCDFAARLGGDEFAIVLEDVATTDDVQCAAERVREVLARRYGAHACQAKVTASIGVATFPESGTTADALVKAADRAMYAAKHSGRNATIIDEALPGTHDLPWGHAFENALSEGEFQLFYQPQVDLDGRLVSAEALLRWERPGHGLVGPGDFLPRLEASDHMVSVGTWIIERACLDFQRLKRAGIVMERIAVNISARQLEDETLIPAVQHALAAANVAPDRLELEVTESAVMKSPEHAAQVLAQLEAMGVRLAMDDFGTGYSSLAHLYRLPFDCVKIDRSFVQDLLDNDRCDTVTRSIVALARELGLSTVAEGVETVQQQRHLRVVGCTTLQGYFFGKPMPYDAFVEAHAPRKRMPVRTIRLGETPVGAMVPHRRG
ncbi:MAG: EAL domain-containing protein [Deltaproteobacteria bacterium]|jgi:diguanylate cyclase (GGDEF)-like protein